MRKGKFSPIVLIVLFLAIMIISGCADQKQYDDLKAQNRIQQQRITSLESDYDAAQVKLQQLEKQLETALSQSSANYGAKGAEIAALERDIASKKALIAKMQTQLLRSGIQLPMELSVKLQEFSEKSDMVSFDESTGVLKFKSDLLFGPGSDSIEPGAIDSIKAFTTIMNSTEAKNFDIVIAGHTDDVPIKKAATKAKHPTNWHLSVHRAISVLNVMTRNGIASERASVRGFGEYRPQGINKANKKGNPVNRRVEIFVVPSGK